MTNESKRDWENLFSAWDFWGMYTAGDVAKIANEIIKKELEKAMTIYFRPSFQNDGLNRPQFVGSYEFLEHDTHTAKLICIKEINSD